MGDLNFRLAEGSYDFAEAAEAIREGSLDSLLDADQLTAVRKDQRAFHELKDTKPSFPPTYKFVIGTQDYDAK